MSEKQTEKQARETLNWIADNYESWKKMCVPPVDESPVEEIVQQLRQLVDQGRYDLFMYILLSNAHQAPIHDALFKTCMNAILKLMEKEDPTALANKLIEDIQVAEKCE